MEPERRGPQGELGLDSEHGVLHRLSSTKSVRSEVDLQAEGYTSQGQAQNHGHRRQSVVEEEGPDIPHTS